MKKKYDCVGFNDYKDVLQWLNAHQDITVINIQATIGHNDWYMVWFYTEKERTHED